jgi:hypothetical protein
VADPLVVYEAQSALTEARYRLNELAADLDRELRGAMVPGSLLDHPRYREAAAAVDAKAAEVVALQTEVGGVVYRVPRAKVDGLVEKLTKLNKKAAKNHLDPVAYRRAGEYVIEYKKGAEFYEWVVLRAPLVKIAGWALLAKLTVEEAGVMVAKVPAFARAWAMHREGLTDEAPRDYYDRDGAAMAAAQEALDSVNLASFANPETATHCDHCKLSRRRVATWVVEELASGELKQVGRNCLAEFLGIDPHNIARYAEWLSDLDDSSGTTGRAASAAGRRPSRPRSTTWSTSRDAAHERVVSEVRERLPDRRPGERQLVVHAERVEGSQRTPDVDRPGGR